MMVVLIQIIQPSTEMTVDHLENGVPVMTITVRGIGSAEGQAYQVIGTAIDTVTGGGPAGQAGEARLPLNARLEQSDLYAHVYIGYSDDGPPFVMDTLELRQQLVGQNTARDLVMQSEAGHLHWLPRAPYGVLTHPDSGTVLIARTR